MEEKGYLAIRSAGSHGAADVVAIKPTKCGHAEHFEVEFIQIKVGKNLKNGFTKKAVETPIGYINLTIMTFKSGERRKK